MVAAGTHTVFTLRPISSSRTKEQLPLHHRVITHSLNKHPVPAINKTLFLIQGSDTSPTEVSF